MSSGNKPDSYKTYENPEVPCNEINFITRILDPQLSALERIDIGDILSVRHTPFGKIEILNASGDFCGVIASPDVDRLYKCMEVGNKYQADVINISNDLCDIRIRYIS